MKPQDIIFFVVLAALLHKRTPRILVFAGIVCLLLSMPLFSLWIFFTAQRLTWYAGAFFLAAIVLFMVPLKKDKK